VSNFSWNSKSLAGMYFNSTPCAAWFCLQRGLTHPRYLHPLMGNPQPFCGHMGYGSGHIVCDMALVACCPLRRSSSSKIFYLQPLVCVNVQIDTGIGLDVYLIVIQKIAMWSDFVACGLFEIGGRT
jgi:hypothetical protein